MKPGRGPGRTAAARAGDFGPGIIVFAAVGDSAQRDSDSDRVADSLRGLSLRDSAEGSASEARTREVMIIMMMTVEGGR